MKLIVAGGRDFTDKVRMARKLTDLVHLGEIPDNPELVCGMARGADMTAYELWKSDPSMIIHQFPADWDKYKKAAGYLRNVEMANFADVLVAFWDGSSPGTKHMINIMRREGKPVHIISY